MNTFTCENCGGVFEKARSDEEANEEYEETFPETQGDETALVCSDCYAEILAWYNG